jgi:hypothetical protein
MEDTTLVAHCSFSLILAYRFPVLGIDLLHLTVVLMLRCLLDTFHLPQDLSGPNTLAIEFLAFTFQEGLPLHLRRFNSHHVAETRALLGALRGPHI